MTDVHKVFISYHHENDQMYKQEFERIMKGRIVPWSVELGDIDDNLPTDTIRRKIRDDYLSDSTVTVVLIGIETWKRKHIDWEIGSSLRDTQNNPRSGLLGILLPTHISYKDTGFEKCFIPPRLYDNTIKGVEFASIYDWSDNPDSIQNWINNAFIRRNKDPPPNNSRPQYKNNRSDNSRGWCTN